jgi:hypothetical protein
MIFFVCKKYLRQRSAKPCIDGKVISKESCLQKSSHNIKYSGFTNHISLPRKIYLHQTQLKYFFISMTRLIQNYAAI